MENDKSEILIVDDEPANITVLNNLLKDYYKIRAVKSGEKAIEIIHNGNIPDLILLDIMMDGIDGYEVCRLLKEDKITSEIPIIFISAKSETIDEEKGLSLGAVDYIAKPFSPPIVLARVNTHIKLANSLKELKMLYSTALDSNPLTGLPGNSSINIQITDAIEKNHAVCVAYCDIDNFKAYNDKYGFAKGDEVILFTVDVIKKAVMISGSSGYFIGHIGGDDFVVIVDRRSINSFLEAIVSIYDREIVKYYPPEDAEAGFIMSTDRKGAKEKFPLASLSIACVDISEKKYTSFIEVNDACASSKKMAKQQDGSSYHFDQRIEPR